MTALFDPRPLVLGTLQNLSLVLERSTVPSRRSGVSGLSVGGSEARAFGGLEMPIIRTGQSSPAKLRYGAITVTPRPQGSAFSRSPGVHPAIDRAYDNPGVRFGDRVRGGERPTSSAGETSCHFSQTSVSKTSPIREMIKAARGGRRLTGSRAAAHVLYVERAGAPEQIQRKGEPRLSGEAFGAEIERRGLARSAVAQQAYIERTGAVEGIARKPGHTITDEALDALDEASFGTIGDTREERTRFWLAVEEAEATPKGDRITIKPAENPVWWSQVAAHVDQAPASAQKPIRDALARNDGAVFDLKLPTDKAFALHQWAVGLDSEAPLEIAPGRGGRTQTRVIAELPHELDGRERLQIVRDFTEKLDEKGFPYWAVIHAPDANNDARNFHVHIAYYDRPAVKMQRPGGTDEVWDFEIQDYVIYKSKTGGAKRHLTRPYQQNRDRTTHDRAWIIELRKHWETVSNRVLEEAGVSKRYNLGSYERMGIDLKPLKHINARTFNKERKGALTEEGPVLARRQWDTVHDRLVKEHEDRARKRQVSITNMADHAARVVAPFPYGSHRVAEVRRLKDLGIKASFQLALLELQQDLTRLVADRIVSRPKLMMQAAANEDRKARRQGASGDVAPQDRAVTGAELFGLNRRSEIATFLTTIYDGALHLDRDNERRSQAARNNVRLIVAELKAWMAEPGRPLHAARRYAPEAVQSLDDPARTERRETCIRALQEGFREAVEGRSTEILQALKAEVSHRSAPQAAQTPPAAAPASSAFQGQEPAATASPTGSTHLAGPTDGRPKPRYTPGRPDGPAPEIGQTGFRPRPEHADLGRFLRRPTLGTGAPCPPDPVRETPGTRQASALPPAEPELLHTGSRTVPGTPITVPPKPQEMREPSRQPNSGTPRPSHPQIDEDSNNAGPRGLPGAALGRPGAPASAQMGTPAIVEEHIATSFGASHAGDAQAGPSVGSRVPEATDAGRDSGRTSSPEPESSRRRDSHPARGEGSLAPGRGQRRADSAIARTDGEGATSVSASVAIGAVARSEDERPQPGSAAEGPSVSASSGSAGPPVDRCRWPVNKEGRRELVAPNRAGSADGDEAADRVPSAEPGVAAHKSVIPVASSAADTLRIVGAQRPRKKSRTRDRGWER